MGMKRMRMKDEDAEDLRVWKRGWGLRGKIHGNKGHDGGYRCGDGRDWRAATWAGMMSMRSEERGKTSEDREEEVRQEKREDRGRREREEEKIKEGTSHK
ncbi:hypothetical protein Pcinc_038761 [Petrolisthes cinctipes]|uniref:Uncharacterized protein n=1 Tax=Petrolisthes cinctipes TaxID=88211 RepID=A0AAE1BR59_PETCI|nr:hypothetical protein Pcinc_038761 [Petrolisthes cinctipes]